MTLYCPECGNESRESQTRYGVRSYCCGLWSWDGAPLVSAETHEARKAAHSAFDELWKRHGMKRGYAYMKLAEEMAIDPELCHIKLMNFDEAISVPGASLRILSRWIKSQDVDVIE